MIIHLRERGLESDDLAVTIIFDMIADGQMISGPCGLRIEAEKLQETIDRIDPDFLNDEQYFPGRPIALKHVRIVES